MDKPHAYLLADILGILHCAEENFFHCFKSEIATPKMALVKSLQDLVDKAKSGTYDNEPDEIDEKLMTKVLQDGGCDQKTIDVIFGRANN